MWRFSRCKIPTAIECFDPGLMQNDSSDSTVKKLTQTRIYLFGIQIGTIEFRTLVEVNVGSIWIMIATTILGYVEKTLLCAPE